MQAIRLHPASPSPTTTPYSPSNPAPPSALHLDTNIPIPKPSKPDELVIRVKATTVVRDMLTWPETYSHEYAIPGNDVAGIVTAVFDEQTSDLKPGDEVFGMTHPDRAGAWAEYALVRAPDEVARKPAALSWEQAAALPLSALTAYEALFVHAGLTAPFPEAAAASRLKKKKKKKKEEEEEEAQAPAHKHPHRRLLITGAAGAVGVHLVQLAAAVKGLHVVAASSSNARNAEFLLGLGADEAVEYAELGGVRHAEFDVVVDAVGGEVLARCWEYVRADGPGVLVSVDSASYDFVQRHTERGIRKDGVRALFFIVQGSGTALRYLAELAERGLLLSLVNCVFPFERVQEAYELASGRYTGRGKVVLTN
ncbi:NADP-dependent oxidoreductase [Aspergillus homomorphus CBS 101889]|uniref:Alcohol dehydrogenase n=1 Tax=Aspergillus homomorphus (strain CBS 101889) TaxID=1450537 RepID=A0A395I6S1_ASPHC|nr:alcohol dehydrogenase [Aspergillus homomorphus CBS 101889]RAL13954.1 alcohol dehydrogenase [Aspergillus homomorphus CBS 101889]